MKKTLILTVIVISATLLCGCQDQQLADCQENSAKLQQTIEQRETEIAKTGKATESSMNMISAILLEGERVKSDLDAAQKENAALKKENARLKAELARTPEERENIRKGIENLRQLQKESAEKLKKAQEAKSAEPVQE